MSKNNDILRIDKLFSTLGILSRSECKAEVCKGNIEVNGERCKSSDTKIVRGKDVVTYKGEIVDTREFVYYMLNKPAGVITANDDPRQKTVFDIIKDKRTDLYAVGRLDKDTTGILIITNDGELGHRMLSPKKHVAKRYIVTVANELTAGDKKLLTQGVDIGDDKPTLPAILEDWQDCAFPLQFDAKPDKAYIKEAQQTKAAMAPGGASNADAIQERDALHTYALTITEGRYHQVKRMFEAVGHPVLALHRDYFGPVKLDPSLSPGEYRELTARELELAQSRD